jgi:hypothetical protein
MELEKRIDKAEKENQMLKEDNEIMKMQISEIAKLTAQLYRQMREEEIKL